MDDMRGNPSCADLERLAAAAASVGHSDYPAVSSHHIASNDATALSTEGLTSTLVPQYSTDPYDLSRTQQYATVRIDFPPGTIFESQRNGHVVTTQHIIAPSHQHSGVSRSMNNYTVMERSNNFGHLVMRGQNFPSSGAFPTQNISNSSNLQCGSTKGMNLIGGASVAVAVSQASEVVAISTSDISGQVVHVIQDDMQGGVSAQDSVIQTSKKRKAKKVDLAVKDKKTNGTKTERYKKSVPLDTQIEDNLSLGEIPAPVMIDGKTCYICDQCGEKFGRKYLFRRHQVSHRGEKRGALSLETKAQIIKRIQAGEKQVDLAVEYNVGRSTLSFIMKNSDKLLSVLKDGKFRPNSKRLRGAQREDVEEALYEWFKQGIQKGLPVSGPILCRKAKDFAQKLGYKEFKATHGWLDRFKHRKNINLTRGKSGKEKETSGSDVLNSGCVEQGHASILMGYEPNDIFYAEELGLLYNLLPNVCSHFKGKRCAGGSHSKKRLTVLLCTNVTGSEKFPLLVIGKSVKPKCFRNVNCLPVQYIGNPKAWMTNERFSAWLQDLDSWFVQQNRKVLLVVPNLPVHPSSPKLNAVRVLISPPDFVGPCKLGIISSFKRNYRRSILELLLSHVEEGKHRTKKPKKGRKKPLELSLLTCLRLLAGAWHAVEEITINKSFLRSGLARYSGWGLNISSVPESNFGTENLELLHKLKLSDFKLMIDLTFDDYVSFDDDVQVCQLMDDDDIIASVTGADADSSDRSDDSDEECENTDLPKGTVSKVEEEGLPLQDVMSSLETLRQYFHYWENGQEMLHTLARLEFLITSKGSAKLKDSEMPLSADLVR